MKTALSASFCCDRRSSGPASAKNTGDFESESMIGATKEDFSRKMLDEYLVKRAERTKRPYNGKIDDLLKEIGAIDHDGNPTVAGILLFTEYPQQWLPQSSVVFAKFVGKTPRGESGLAGYTREISCLPDTDSGCTCTDNSILHNGLGFGSC